MVNSSNMFVLNISKSEMAYMNRPMNNSKHVLLISSCFTTLLVMLQNKMVADCPGYVVGGMGEINTKTIYARNKLKLALCSAKKDLLVTYYR